MSQKVVQDQMERRKLSIQHCHGNPLLPITYDLPNSKKKIFEEIINPKCFFNYKSDYLLLVVNEADLVAL